MTQATLPILTEPKLIVRQPLTTRPFNPKEYKIVSLRECVPTSRTYDTPERIAEYWHHNIPNQPYFNPDVESLYVIMLNARRKVTGHQLVANGTADTILCHPREVFRAAIIGACHAIILMHNLCVAAHKLCYVKRRVMCSPRLAGLALHQLSVRKECCGCA